MALEAPLKLCLFSLKSPVHRGHGFSKKKPLCVQVFQSAAHVGSEIIDEEITQMFLKDRQTNGDFVSKVSDMLWIGETLKFADSETSNMQQNLQQHDEVVENENVGGFLKLTTTHEWVSADSVVAPENKKLASKDWQNDSEKRKKLNLLRYEAIKRELLLLTIGIGAGCCVYCLVELSVESATSYAAGVFFRNSPTPRIDVNWEAVINLESAQYGVVVHICAIMMGKNSCLYLQLLSHHIDNLSSEAIPKKFLQKRLKKIGIRSEDLKDTVEKIFWGSTMALSSPRLVIPAALYGIWILSQHILPNFEFQIVPAMLGFFAYKAAALVQVYRDNEDLRLIFPDNEENPSSY